MQRFWEPLWSKHAAADLVVISLAAILRGVKLTRIQAYTALLAAAPLIELVGSATGYPTHASLLVRALLLAGISSFIANSRRFAISLGLRLILPTLYVVSFIAVSYYGVNWNFSVLNRVLWLPLILIDFVSWYCVAYYAQDHRYFRYFGFCVALFGLISLALAQTGIIDPEETRVIFGPDVPMAVAPAVFASGTFLTGILLALSLLSLKKTVVACAFVAFLCALIGKLLCRRNPWPKPKPLITGIPVEIKWLVGAVMGVAALTAVIIVGYPYISATLGRISGDGEDVLRLAAAYEFVQLVGEYWPQGTGFYTFGWLSADDIPFFSTTLSGEVLEGMPLHNTYMHYILEGGLVVCIVMLLLHISYFRVIFKLYKGNRQVAIALISWMLIAVIFGMFQQWHAWRYFFGIFGYAAGAADHLKRRVLLARS